MARGYCRHPSDDSRFDNQFIALGGAIVHVHALSLALLAACARACADAPRDRVIHTYIHLADALNVGGARALAAVLDADASGCISSALVELRELKTATPSPTNSMAASLDAVSAAGVLRPPRPVAIADGVRFRTNGDGTSSVTLTIDPARTSPLMAGAVLRERVIDREQWMHAVNTVVPRATLYANGCHEAGAWYAAAFAMSPSDGDADPAAVGWARAISAMLEAWTPGAPEALEDCAATLDYVTGPVCTLLCAYGSAIPILQRGALAAMFHPRATAWHLSDMAALCANSMGAPTRGPLEGLMRALARAPAAAIVEVLHGISMPLAPPQPPPPALDPHKWLTRRVDTHRYVGQPSPAMFNVLYAIEHSWRTGSASLVSLRAPQVPHATVSLTTTVVVDDFDADHHAAAVLRPVYSLEHV